MPPKRPRPAPANFAALRHYSLAPLPSSTTTTTTTTPSTALTTEIQSLRRLIMDQELSISTLRQQLPSPTTTPSPNTPPSPKTHLRTLRARKTAHDTTFATIDHLPPAASPLNLLLAYRSVLLVTSRTAESLVTVKAAISAAAATLDREAAELGQQRAITEALVRRLEREEGEGEGEGGGRGVAEMVKRRKEVGRRTAGVLREEGEAGEEPEKRMARDFMEVLESLMNASLENDPYIPMKQDTAIVRFLVRAKVAAFHPKDARRLRLVDFGSSVEDG
ncbi:uncharacterized protein LAJ45_11393 [Morchella importuna]|nr:uncharacterized protein LAJ45_11393 [Morchella importuna]KAH8144625.1 hypothetical protein LAJ45_11393 [Morchella importuna]